MVFDFFQDLYGFSLDDYQPLSDINSGLSRIVAFLSSSVSDRGQSLVKRDPHTYVLTGHQNRNDVTFTLDRDTATKTETVELLGIDHPVVQDELTRRNITAETLGISVQSEDGQSAFLCFWRVDSNGKGGEGRTTVHTIAVQKDVTRVPAIERAAKSYIDLSTVSSPISDEERISMFSQVIEPTLKRELRHKGTADGEGSYIAELIGYVEIV